MQYVTSIERLAKQEGIQEGFVRLLTTQLAQRFGQVPDWVSKKLAAATPEALESWGRKLLEVRSLEELFA